MTSLLLHYGRLCSYLNTRQKVEHVHMECSCSNASSQSPETLPFQSNLEIGIGTHG